MRLAIFDLDDTLLTAKSEWRCFDDALLAEFDITDTWEEPCIHMTDGGILREVVQRHLKRPPTVEEVQQFERRFVGFVSEAFETKREDFREIPGAFHMLHHLRHETDWYIGIATGCWRSTATLKLEGSGVALEGIPLATADDGLSREEIVTSCIRRAEQMYGVKEFPRIVSLGDGPWDVQTARNLGLPFICIGSGLADHDVATVPDYRDLDRFIHLLDSVDEGVSQ